MKEKQWWHSVQVGDMLHPDPLWNHTERGPNCLTVPTKVLGITEATSQSGVLFEVRTKGGFIRRLDADWFMRPNVEFSGDAPLFGAASAGTQGSASDGPEKG